ncbi:MAG: XamI family restriction endonuclease [Mesorhizobium sp.]|uniref:XamI family restriction endonuclease n=1 Tax=Mesorhizobium sp. TaxID=1871066 RepID=UPI000FE61D18|nr:XamI family restriction endonuclease [Mesorhizobium sp.]RWM86473.1 MAG: XamI family restriction endonuclease [Mesorhizobium sp.]
MNIPNSKAPRVWSGEELACEAQTALEEFVDRRLKEPEGRYATQVRSRRKAIIKLFKVLSGVDPANPEPAVVRSILLDDDLFGALRYIAAPPVSEDDLGVLVTRKILPLSKTALRGSDPLVLKVLALLCRLADPYRFPWIAAKRTPSPRELRTAIQTTTILQASQALQTERRGHGKIVEGRLESRLTELGFAKVSAPHRGIIDEPVKYPVYPTFYGECTVHGRKVDLFIPLQTGRMIALEAKDSSSGLNSVKRLNNDTAAKAKHFAAEAGKNIVNVALLSGVFKLSSLVSAQNAGLYLVWAHDLDGFIDWVKAQT